MKNWFTSVCILTILLKRAHNVHLRERHKKQIPQLTVHCGGYVLLILEQRLLVHNEKINSEMSKQTQC